MKTRKPISTITYLDTDFLKIELDKLVTNRTIDFYCFISHHPEEDEKKEHKHLFILPNGQLDTNQLNDTLTQAVPEDPLHPKKCMPFRNSKFPDYYLYSKHDTNYLMQKGQTRKYHYRDDDFIVSDDDYFRELIHEIDFSKINRIQFIKEAIEMGKSWEDIVISGQVPAQQYAGYFQIFKVIQDFTRKSVMDSTFRNGKDNHEVDEETGEVIESTEEVPYY